MVKAKLRGISTKDRGGTSLGIKAKFKPSPKWPNHHKGEAFSLGDQNVGFKPSSKYGVQVKPPNLMGRQG